MTKLRSTTWILLRAFKRFNDRIPEEARPYVAQAFGRWKRKFGRRWLRTMLAEWSWLENLIECWGLIDWQIEKGGRK